MSPIDAIHDRIRTLELYDRITDSPYYWFYSELIFQLDSAYERELSIREVIYVMTSHQNLKNLHRKSRRKNVKQMLEELAEMCPTEYESLTKEAVTLLKPYA